MGKVGCRDRLSIVSPRDLKLAGGLFLLAAGLLFLVGLLAVHLGLAQIPLALALALPFLLMGLVAVGMWLFILASARSTLERRIAKYVSTEERARIEREVEGELQGLSGKELEVAKKVLVKRRVEELYQRRAEAEFMEALKKRLRFKAGESVLAMASRQWSGSTLFLFSLPLLLIAMVVLSGFLGWALLAVLLLMALYFSSQTQSVLYIATNRRLIKRTQSSSLFRRSEGGEELRWSAVKQLKVSRGRRGLKVQLKGEDEIINVEGLKQEDAERLLKVIEEQVAARAERRPRG